jgi:acetoin utilization protein AcuB
MYNIDRARLPQLREELREKAALLYMVDHRENRRDIYETQPKVSIVKAA